MAKLNTGGSMVFIASMSGYIVNWPSSSARTQRSVAHYGIRVNLIFGISGFMDTVLNRVPALDAQKKLWKERTPMGLIWGVDELNNLVVFPGSDADGSLPLPPQAVASATVRGPCIFTEGQGCLHGG
ncbi:hypothetical protein FN846DRAFT_802330 [Sphaerosporella brunnea]|uniref:Uncharacterized protein n=1 Tax=Sphaerosporella brunnea TaxID=1250544 RepID=A0A5J5EKI5_9PEZI|nr:hypothetical protein FN846DRAFT_802330 [Sphaerosporella brunnea]